MSITHLLKDRSKNIILLMSLYVFFLPLRNHISSVIGFLLFLNFFFDKQVNLKAKLKILIENKIAILSISLYILHIIGLLYTSNFKYAGLDLEIKLPLLIIPLTLFSEKTIETNDIKKIFQFFTLGNLVTILYCSIYAVYSYGQTNSISVFFYNNLSRFMHPSYFSMYLGFNVIIVLQSITALTKNKHVNKKKISYLFILCTVFLIFITLLSSKAGILIVGICSIIITIREIFKRKFYLVIYFTSILSILIFILLTNQNTTTSKRFTEAKNELITNKSKKPEEKVGSSDTRMEVWKASTQLLKNHYLIGVGTGDVKDELIKQYKKNNFILGVQNNFNCHNQFLQFFLIIGIIGLVIFTLIIIISIVSGIQSKNSILLYFLIFITLNMLMESILESKAGVEFYAFFLPFLVKNNYKIEE